MEFKFCILKSVKDGCLGSRSDCYYSFEDFLLSISSLPLNEYYTFLVVKANNVYRFDYFSGSNPDDSSIQICRFISFYGMIKEGLI